MAEKVEFDVTLLVNGKENLVKAAIDVKQLAREIEDAGTVSAKLRDELLKLNQAKEAFDNLHWSLQKLMGGMQDLIDANTQQVEAEKKLAVNMRNMMDATDEEVESIKRLCAAQQELGVIGDEVQIAGAQELATYLEKKSSLEELIPVMNDMLAQQYGLNATQEQAATIAQMLGKVMEGQVGALSRYGYYFDEAQQEILKFGTEEERAATLAEIVEGAVGGMNAELAKTDAGRAKQAANDLGDLKEAIGGAVAPLETYLVMLGSFGTAVNGVVQFTAGMKGAVAVVSGFNIVQRISSGVQALWAYQMRLGLQASIAWAFGAKVATVQAIALRAAILGLMAVTGVGLVLAAASVAMGVLGNKAMDAAEGMREAKKAEEELAESMKEATGTAYSQAVSGLELQKTKLKELIEAKKEGRDVGKEEKKIVGELNDAYGSTMGYFASMEEWYRALVANSEAYCEQMIVEAKTRMLADQIAKKEMETRNLMYDEKGQKRMYSKKRKTTAHWEDRIVEGRRTGTWVTDEIEGSSEIEKVTAKIRENNAIVANMRGQMKKAAKEAAEIKMPVMGSGTRPGNSGSNGNDGKDEGKKRLKKANEDMEKRMKRAEDERVKREWKSAEELRKAREQEMEDMWRYLEEYGSYEQRRQALMDEYDERIRKAGSGWEAESLRAERDERIGRARLEEVKEEIDWEGVFGDLEGYSVEFLNGVRERLQQLLRSGELGAEDAKVVAEKMDEIDEVVRDKGGSTFRWISESMERQKRAAEETKRAEDELQAARASKAGAEAELEGAKEDVARRSGGMVDAATVTSGDKQAVMAKMPRLGMETMQLEEAFGRLERAEARVAAATGEVTRAEGKRAAAGEKEKVPAKERVANWMEDLRDNVEKYLGDVPGLLDEIGWGEMGARVQSGIDGVNSAANAAADLATANYAGAAMNAVKSLKSFAGVFGGESNHEEMVEVQQEISGKLDAINRTVEKGLETLAGVYGEKALEQSKELKEKIEGNQEYYRQGVMVAGDDNYGGGHSEWWHRNKNGGKELVGLIGQRYGIDFGDNSMQSLYNTLASMGMRGAEILNEIRETQADWWWQLTNGNSYDEGAIGGWVEKWADSWEEYREVVEQTQEQMAGTSFDTAFDDFMNSMYKLAAGSEGVMDDIADNWQEMVNRMVLNNIIGEKMKERLQGWYDDFAKEYEEAGEDMDVERLRKRYMEIVEDGAQEVERLRSMGIVDEVSSAGSGQSGRSGSFSTMTQDQAGKLEGLFTSGLMHWSSMDERMEDVVGKMGMAGDRLARIEEHTGRSAVLLGEIREMQERMMRDGVRVR